MIPDTVPDLSSRSHEKLRQAGYTKLSDFEGCISRIFTRCCPLPKPWSC